MAEETFWGCEIWVRGSSIQPEGMVFTDIQGRKKIQLENSFRARMFGNTWDQCSGPHSVCPSFSVPSEPVAHGTQGPPHPLCPSHCPAPSSCSWLPGWTNDFWGSRLVTTECRDSLWETEDESGPGELCDCKAPDSSAGEILPKWNPGHGILLGEFSLRS